MKKTGIFMRLAALLLALFLLTGCGAGAPASETAASSSPAGPVPASDAAAEDAASPEETAADLPQSYQWHNSAGKLTFHNCQLPLGRDV